MDGDSRRQYGRRREERAAGPPGARAAEELRAFIQEETDYDVRVGSSAGGFMRKKTWTVAGTTQPTKHPSRPL
jgi:hypothetical protein